MLLHYLGKLKNQKFAILVHIKHVSNVTGTGTKYAGLHTQCLRCSVHTKDKFNIQKQ